MRPLPRHGHEAPSPDLVIAFQNRARPPGEPRLRHLDLGVDGGDPLLLSPRRRGPTPQLLIEIRGLRAGDGGLHAEFGEDLRQQPVGVFAHSFRSLMLTLRICPTGGASISRWRS